MHLAIIGSGSVGGALAQAFAAMGHEVRLGVRNPESETAKALAAGSEHIAVATLADAAAVADLVVLAVPFGAVAEAIAALGDISGKILIDATNPLGQTDDGFGLTLGHTSSGGEQVAALAQGAHVVKTLNQIGWEVMRHAKSFSNPPVLFMAGEDSGAKATVAALLESLGFDPVDAGGIAKSRLLEPFGMLWINQAILRGDGRHFSFARQQRESIGA